MLTCYDIADYFIRLANETGSFISNLKLQKMVYYAQAWHLAIKNEPLFAEDFEAWVHGPVIPELYQKYRHFRWLPIEADVTPNLPEDVKEFLAQVADEYFSCDAYQLEQMTHLEAPWSEARGNLPLDRPSSNTISKESIREYYASRAEESSVSVVS